MTSDSGFPSAAFDAWLTDAPCEDESDDEDNEPRNPFAERAEDEAVEAHFDCDDAVADYWYGDNDDSESAPF